MNDLSTNLPDGTRRLDLAPERVTARMAQFCEWFGVEPVKLKVRKGKVYLSDDLLAWCDRNEVSIDWLLCGDIRPVFAAYRHWVTLMRLVKLKDEAGETSTPAAVA